ncbi:MAG: type II toxin-antitoxin system RelE/ParE family toxin [Sterolibacterium sp.]|nr:type II toxin-antitoxin system RelE/ParE family toxin [Sterolibacterium sp.]
MKTFKVVFTPEAEDQLVSLYRYIAGVTSPETTARYIEAIITYCETLRAFPHLPAPWQQTR